MTTKGLIRLCDKLYRQIIRNRDKVCQRCGRSYGKLEVGHFYSRRYKSVRWDLDNGKLLCFQHHYVWAHGNPKEFAEWWEKRLGSDRFDMLRMKKSQRFDKDYGMILMILEKLAEGLCD